MGLTLECLTLGVGVLCLLWHLGFLISVLAGVLVGCVATPALVMLTLRLCEESMSAARSVRESWSFLRTDRSKLEELRAMRQELEKDIRFMNNKHVNRLLDARALEDAPPPRAFLHRSK